MNKGERDELLIKLKLIEMRDKRISFFGENIERLGFGDSIYRSLPSEVNLQSIRNNDSSIISLCQTAGISKASHSYKSDVFINNKGYSLKSLSAAPPALMNHTTRPGFETACNFNKVEISKLDEIISDYWSKRKSGEIGEDVPNFIGNSVNLCSPFVNHKEYFRPILEYFLFVGSGTGPSLFPSEYILDYNDPLNPSTWKKIGRKEAIDLLWSKLIFSIRATKGMPKSYDPNKYTGKGADSIKLWVNYSNNKYRGALHIRVRG